MLEDSHPAEPAVKSPPARPSGVAPPPPEVAAEPVASEEFSIAEVPVVARPAGSHEVDSFELPVEAPATLEKQPNSFADISAEIPPVREQPAPPSAAAPEFELDQDFELVLEPEPLVPAYDQKPPETPVVPKPESDAVHAAQNATVAPPAAGFASDQFLADLAKEIDDLGLDALTPSHSEAAPQAAPPKPVEKPA